MTTATLKKNTVVKKRIFRILYTKRNVGALSSQYMLKFINSPKVNNKKNLLTVFLLQWLCCAASAEDRPQAGKSSELPVRFQPTSGRGEANHRAGRKYFHTSTNCICRSRSHSSNILEIFFIVTLLMYSLPPRTS